MTDRSDKTHSPGDNALANLYQRRDEIERERNGLNRRDNELWDELIEVENAIKEARDDSGAKI